jgi:site-specific DNA-methyltransferase (adenine-specific)
MDLKTNVLYYGDNLDILRKHIPDESIDLIYLDPPFNSNRSYNVLFRESGGAGSEAQIEAFEDTWQWGPAAQATYEEVVTGPHQRVARTLQAMVDGLGHNDVTAYLSMMAIRLVELHRVLKPTGSIYLHCDPTTGHYLKMLMDSVFGPRNFLNEIAWKRTYAHGSARRYGPVHDTLLFYAKGEHFRWTGLKSEHDPEYIARHFTLVDPECGRRFQPITLTGSGIRHADSGKPWRGIDPSSVGRHWALPGALIESLGIEGSTTQERLDALDAAGMIYWPQKAGGTPRLKLYADELGGVAMPDVWTDIPPISAQAAERLGYPTQKPLALLERIVSASSNPGDIVLDPFCGCGTAVHAAHKLGRRWIGIDITHLAIGLIRRRMQDAFSGIAIEVIGEPVDLAGAHELAQRDKYQFQWWALDRLGAQPVSGKKKGADKGIDGVVPFFAGPKEDYKRAIVSVKGGEHVNVAMLRDLKGVLEREKEPIGILLTLASPTRDMITEAAAAGFYESEFWERKFPRVQILTIEDMLGGKRPDMPWGKAPFAKAQAEKERAEQAEML